MFPSQTCSVFQLKGGGCHGKYPILFFFNNIVALSIKNSYKCLQFFLRQTTEYNGHQFCPVAQPTCRPPVAVECRCSSYETSSKEHIVQPTKVSD